MSRCILVLSIPRTGSSALASVLHRLGVHMGDRLQPADVLNPKGYWEDLDFQQINKELAGYAYDVQIPESVSEETLERYQKIIDKREDEHEIWGVKNPRMVFTAQYVWPLISDVRLLGVKRDFSDSIDSMYRHSQMAYGGTQQRSKEEITTLMQLWRDEWRRRMAAFDGPSMAISYEVLMDDPTSWIDRLSDWCFEGMDKPSAARKMMAVGVLTPELRHFA